MNLRELTQLASPGEGPYLEFKRKVPEEERIAKEVIAFANTRGGRVLVGVDDDGSLVGVKDAGEEEYALLSALRNRCRPEVAIRTERVPLSKKRDVIVVHIPESQEKPHFLTTRDQETSTAYVRVEDKSVEATREDVRLMRAAQQPVDVLFEFGEKEQMLMRYLDTYGRITVSQFASLANIPSRQASHTLVLLTKGNVLQHHRDERENYFTLAY